MEYSSMKLNKLIPYINNTKKSHEPNLERKNPDKLYTH